MTANPTDLKIKQSGLYGNFGKSTPMDFILNEKLWHYTKMFSSVGDKDSNVEAMRGTKVSAIKDGRYYDHSELLKRCYNNLSASKKYGHKKRKVQ